MELKKKIQGLTFNGEIFKAEEYEIIYKNVNGQELLSVDNGKLQFIIPIEKE